MNLNQGVPADRRDSLLHGMTTVEELEPAHSPPRLDQKSTRLRRATAFVVPPVAFAGLFVAAWYGFSYLVLTDRNRFLVPPPHIVWHEGLGHPAGRAQLLEGLWVTTQEAMVGLAVAILIGLSFAVLMSQARWVERSFYPWAVVLQTIPVLALVPLIGIWFGRGFVGRVIVCVLIALFPIITNSLFGLQSADEGLHDLLTLHGADRATRFRKLELRAAVPAMFTGFRISAGLSVIGAIVGEFFFVRGGQSGLGNLLDLYRGQLETSRLLTALFLSSMLGILVFWGFTWIGNFLIRSWHETAHVEVP
ncbi:MAG: ABC transporter permease [Actinomycetota bacterium]